jgi:hypothetical protein
MSSVVISGDTSGTVSLTVPSVAGNNTITLPASTGTVITTASPQSGSVLQVVQATFTNNFSTTTNGFVSTQVTASITPKFSTSKILVQISPVVFITGATTDAGTGFGILRGATQIYSTSYIAFYSGIANAGTIPYIQYLDSPATTSSTTYTLQVTRYTNNGGTTVQINRNYVGTDTSVITLTEIAA